MELAIEPEDYCLGVEMDRRHQSWMMIELANYYSMTAPVDHLNRIVRQGHSEIALT